MRKSAKKNVTDVSGDCKSIHRCRRRAFGAAATLTRGIPDPEFSGKGTLLPCCSWMSALSCV
jgi:hypothetical protein